MDLGLAIGAPSLAASAEADGVVHAGRNAPAPAAGAPCPEQKQRRMQGRVEVPEALQAIAAAMEAANMSLSAQ
ncbi:MAG TPA: hypothetical protein VLC06_25275 [Polyangia bacterium]|nr:hypothetical protein [Polyangia bacterium]